ncbi:P27 family phage terminase small subunit [Streptomyces sp. NPDC055254]
MRAVREGTSGLTETARAHGSVCSRRSNRACPNCCLATPSRMCGAKLRTVSASLTDAQRETAVEHCVTVARLWQAERELSRHGLVVAKERGNVKSPCVTIAHQYRSHFRSLVGELGLSPASATRITPPEFSRGDDDGIFD